MCVVGCVVFMYSFLLGQLFRIRVGRSIEGFGLSPGITREQRQEVEKLMKSAFGKLEGDLSGKLFVYLSMIPR